MKIRLKYFGLGKANLPEYIELPERTNIEQLIHSIQDSLELPLEHILASSFLVNNSKADKNTVLNDGDEVLILRTLGGG